MESNLYLFIIWEKSRNNADIIFEDIEKKFIIRNVYEIKWSEEEFADNLKRFYGSTLSNVEQKAELCGMGPFLLIIISDPSPRLEEKALDNMNKVSVNINTYDSKMKYRKWIGIDFALHGSNSEKETNHDLILLLGKNIQDLERDLPEKWNGSIKKMQSELIGHNGWTDIRQFLYVLNGIMRYVILRNFEDLPYKFSHKDIDVLTDDVKMMSHIINEKKSAIGKAPVKMGDKTILLDFRYQVGHHYDEKWSKDVLNRRVLHPNGFYVPCKEDYFYTLLYHAIRQKHIRNDYKKTLSDLAKELEINEDVKMFDDFNKSKKFLEKYMAKMGYHKTTIQHRILYKVRHSEFMRLVKVSIFFAKTQGMGFLLTKIKEKIKLMSNAR